MLGFSRELYQKKWGGRSVFLVWEDKEECLSLRKWSKNSEQINKPFSIQGWHSGLRLKACLLKEGNESGQGELGLWRSVNEMWLTGKVNKWVNERAHKSIGLEKNVRFHELNFSDFHTGLLPQFLYLTPVFVAAIQGMFPWLPCSGGQGHSHSKSRGTKTIWDSVLGRLALPGHDAESRLKHA